MKKTGILILLIINLIGCTLIKNDDNLTESDLKYIRSLGLIDENENILKFSSSMNIKTSGNFITDKRLASYWIDKDDNKSYKDFAFYSDIVKIDSVDKTNALTYASYLEITKRDSSRFKVYIDGDKDKYRSFIKIANTKWSEHK
jgi:hypothetical protein